MMSLLFLAGCKEKYEYLELGFKLSDDYYETKIEGKFDRAFTNDKILMGITRISLDACMEDGILTTHTPLKFASLYRERMELSDISEEVKERGDVPYFTYTRDSEGQKYLYVPTFYKSMYAYFVVIFITPLVAYEEQVDECLAMAQTFYFVDI